MNQPAWLGRVLSDAVKSYTNRPNWAHNTTMNTQTKAKHTPGPWKFGYESIDPNWAIVTGAGGHIVANVNSESGPDLPPLVSAKLPQEANARLISAAPELLEACERALYCVKYRDPQVYGEMVKAIAKATGETL